MRILLFIFLITNAINAGAQNPYVGTWSGSLLKPLMDTDSLIDPCQHNFTSSITFFENLTYVKIACGDTTKGEYKFKKNKLKFWIVYENGQKSFLQSSFWGFGKGDPDPYDQTPEFDFTLDEYLNVITRKGHVQRAPVEVLYKKNSQSK
ncbi:MAG TPA: hypothetical protein VK177_03075 [Flavobacteriales bacterium]|nr:hypothetical protein [Flavobacteriales bacterium]